VVIPGLAAIPGLVVIPGSVATHGLDSHRLNNKL